MEQQKTNKTGRHKQSIRRRTIPNQNNQAHTHHRQRTKTHIHNTSKNRPRHNAAKEKHTNHIPIKRLQTL